MNYPSPQPYVASANSKKELTVPELERSILELKQKNKHTESLISTTYNIQQSSKEQSRTILQHRKSLQQLSRLEKEELLDLQQKKFKLLNSSSFNSSIPTKAYNFSFESKNIFALFLILSIILIAATYLSIGSIASNNSEDQSFFSFFGSWFKEIFTSGNALTGAAIADAEEIPSEIIPLSPDLNLEKVPALVPHKKLKKNKNLSDLLKETKPKYPAEMIKEIRQINYAAEEIIFKDKLEKALIVHKPLFDGQTLEEFIPLQEKDDFTYGAVFEDTAVDIEFDSPAITQDKAGKRYSQKKSGGVDSWKTEYGFSLPAENFTIRFRVSSTSPILITNPSLGEMETGQFQLTFRSEAELGYTITSVQVQPQIVYVYLAKNYTAEGINPGDYIVIDPTLSISNSAMRVCGDVMQYDIVNVNTAGVLEICPQNATNPATSGWVNFTLGYYGNFSLDSTSKIEGKARGAAGGLGNSTSGGTGYQGDNGNNVSTGRPVNIPNGGGGGGGTKVVNTDSAAGCGGGFGGNGGKGGASAGTACQIGAAYGTFNNLILKTGAGGAGGAGDVARTGGTGGAGIKIVTGAGGWVGIRGTVNLTGGNGTNAVAGTADSAGGGGGSGGHMVIVAGKLNLVGAQIRADGGGGGLGTGTDSCPGGGGGGGRVYIVYQTLEANASLFTTNAGYHGSNISSDTVCNQISDALGPSHGANGTFQMNGTHLDLLPVISLTAPANLTTNTTDNTPEFIFNVSDDLFTQSFLNCSLWMGNASTTAAYGTNNTVFNRTKTVITANSTLNNGPYEWWINCSDGVDPIYYQMDRTNKSEVRNITISITPPDLIPPIVNLSSPANNTWIKNESRGIDFVFTATDDNNIFNCTLWTNYTGVFNQNKTNQSLITMGAPQTIKQNFSNDFTALLWNVQCCDAAGNCAMNQTNAVGTGGNRTVRLDATFPSSFSEYYNVSSSGRFPETYEWVNFSAKWIDLNLSNCGFMLNNATPFYANYTPKPCQSGWNISFIEQMNATDNQNISWIFWANDSAGNLNFTSVFSLVVRNESPKFKSDNINISVYPRTYQWLNFSVNWTDNSWFGRNSDKLQTCGFMLNNGTPTFVNYSWKLCSSGWNISFIEIMNATDNQNVSWVFWANDTTNNINFTPAFSIVMRNESPVFYSNITNSTTQKQNDWVNFSINWTDNSWFGRNSDKLQNCWFGVKDGTPTMVNTTPIPCSSGWNISFVEQISDVAGQTVFYQFYANDTTNNVNATYLSSFVIAAANTLPTTPLTFSPANGSSIVNRTPAFSWVNSTDADGNVISYHLQVDDNLRFNNPEINVTAIVPTAGNENTTYYPSAVLNVDTTYYWRVRANDSIGFGGWSNNAANDGPGGGPGEGQNRSNFTVNSYLAITLYNTPIEFGVLNPGAVENTTDGSPLPILGVNDGNIFFNLSINASSYFETAAMNTSNYQYKFRANESGSFDTALSTITWTNMSKDPLSRVDVAECNWRDVNDDFLMDLNITLPIDEPAGLKMSNITYTVTSSSIS